MKFYSTLVLFSTVCTGLACENELTTTADCTCRGENITYECSVLGGSITVWNGTVMGDNCEVSLSHNQNFSTSREYCNNTAVVGQGIRNIGNCYTSRLTIQTCFNSMVEGQTVNCNVDYGNRSVTINSTIINFTREPFLPPENVQLIYCGKKTLTFSWTKPPMLCPSLTYDIQAKNCCDCPNTSVSTSVTCICNNLTQHEVCTFGVRSVICGNLYSTNYSMVTVNLTAEMCQGNTARGIPIGIMTTLLMVLITCIS